MTFSSHASPKRLLVVYGTRGEAITMAPLISSLRADPRFKVRVVTTGMHQKLVDQVHRSFGIVPDRQLVIGESDRTPTGITAQTLRNLAEILEIERPDAVLVRGSTLATCAASLASFYAGVPVVHVEAGLRVGDRSSPSTDDANRRVTAQMAALHLAPTWRSRDNLLHEGIDANAIVVTGTPIVDAFLGTEAARPGMPEEPIAAHLTDDKRMVLVSVQASEQTGRKQTELSHELESAVARLAADHPDHVFVLTGLDGFGAGDTSHSTVRRCSNIAVTPPLPHNQFCSLLKRSHLVVTDSGGVQVEGALLNKPLLVVRDSTDRPEAVAVGAARLIGPDEQAIVDQTSTLLQDDRMYRRMVRALNPYNDGLAAPRAVQALARYFDLDTGDHRLPTGLSSVVQ